MAQRDQSFLGKGISAPIDDLEPLVCQRGIYMLRLVFHEDTPYSRLDQALSLSLSAGYHLQLAAGTTPGYHPQQPACPNVFFDEQTQIRFCAFWAEIAQRFVETGDHISFVPLHNPYGYWDTVPDLGPAEYAVVMRKVVQCIHQVHPDRQIVIDGLNKGKSPPTDLFDLASSHVSLSWRINMAEPSYDAAQTGMAIKIWAAYARETGQGILCQIKSETLQNDRDVKLDRLIRLLREHNIGYLIERNL